MGAGAVAPLLIGTTAAGAATSVVGAVSQNRALSASADSARRAQRATGEQLARRSGVDLERLRRRSNQVIARQQTDAIRRGIDLGGSTLDLVRAADFDRALNTQILQDNLALDVAALDTRTDATISGLRARGSSPVLAGLSGGLAGLQTGLAIVTAGQQIDQLEAAQAEGV